MSKTIIKFSFKVIKAHRRVKCKARGSTSTAAETTTKFDFVHVTICIAILAKVAQGVLPPVQLSGVGPTVVGR